MKNPRTTDADDMFSDTRMSFGDHIEELRGHLWRAIVGFLAVIVGCFALDGIGLLTNSNFGVGRPVMRFMAKPVEDALDEFYKHRVQQVAEEIKSGKKQVGDANVVKDVDIELDMNPIKRKLGLGEIADDAPDFVTVHGRVAPLSWAMALMQAETLVTRPGHLVTFNVTEAMFIYFKVALVCGIVLSSPWLFWQIWSFVAAGLYPNEKRYVNVYLPFSLCLFLAGVAMCEFVVLPRAVEALLWFNKWLNLEPTMRLDEWLSFAIWMPVVFGVSFQTPLVMLFLERIGVMNIDYYRRKRRIAWFVLAIFASVMAPPDPYSMMCMWLAMCSLYELGILLCKWSPRPQLDIEVPETEEMVEV